MRLKVGDRVVILNNLIFHPDVRVGDFAEVIVVPDDNHNSYEIEMEDTFMHQWVHKDKAENFIGPVDGDVDFYIEVPPQEFFAGHPQRAKRQKKRP